MSCLSALAFTSPTFKAGPKIPHADPPVDLSIIARERGIEFFLVAFVDLKGALRSKMVPATAIAQVQKAGAGFAPFAAWFDYGPDAPDLIVIPEPSSLFQVPFQPELAIVFGDCFIGGEPVAQAPRQILKAQIKKATDKGYVFKTGVEPEFFLLSNAGEDLAVSDPKDTGTKPCYDAQALMRRYAFLKDVSNTLNANNFGVYQADHEDANGQFEINWNYQDCQTTADQHVFFKWAVKTLAEMHGFRATFMPRPFANLAGNGCHVHCSLWSGTKNLFQIPADAKPIEEGAISLSNGEMSNEMHYFLGGIIAKAASLCAITNPTVNSYKRLNGATTTSGATWSPNRISWSGNNRTHMVRVPDSDRFEFRLADGAVNPYLLQAAVLAAGLWGIDSKADPSKCYFKPTVNMYEIPDGDVRLKEVAGLPLNLLDALRAFEADGVAMGLLNPEFARAFLKLKRAEWTDHQRFLTKFELEQTLEC